MYIPATEEDRQAMLAAIGAASIDELFECIPPDLRRNQPLNLPPALTEMELTNHIEALASRNQSAGVAGCFLGAGCYDHFIPAVVDTIAARSEYYTAYTPYQAEASQGTLQVGFEYQTLVSQLTGLPVANASLYEGATAMVEAALVARNVTNRPHQILCSATVHPEYAQTLSTYLKGVGAELVLIPASAGKTDLAELAKLVDPRTACVIVQSPNFFGLIESVGQTVAIARESGAPVIQVFDPIALGVLRRPGDYGVELAVAEGQSLGTPMSYGGPFLGMFACTERYLRKMPGRVVGQTVDRHGKPCFVLTLQTREQHIRREKATSNICTNQGLLALRASVYLSLMGPVGMREVAQLCWSKAQYTASELARVPGIRLRFPGKFFKEFVIELPGLARDYLPAMLEAGFHAGVPLDRWFPSMERCLLIAVTEKRTRAEIDRYVAAWRRILA